MMGAGEHLKFERLSQAAYKARRALISNDDRSLILQSAH